MFALTIEGDGRILSATFDKYAAPDMPLVETLPDGDITDYLYKNGKYIYDPLTPPDLTPAERVAELKRMLADTDYIVIKVSEGVATWEDYPNIKEQRQAWRDEINALENIESTT